MAIKKMTFSLDDETIEMLKSMATKDKTNSSHFIRWLVLNESRKRKENKVD